MALNQYKCGECGATFNNEAALEEHNRNVHSRYRCEECGQIFSSENELNIHTRVAHPEQEVTPRS